MYMINIHIYLHIWGSFFVSIIFHKVIVYTRMILFVHAFLLISFYSVLPAHAYITCLFMSAHVFTLVSLCIYLSIFPQAFFKHTKIRKYAWFDLALCTSHRAFADLYAKFYWKVGYHFFFFGKWTMTYSRVYFDTWLCNYKFGSLDLMPIFIEPKIYIHC